MNKKKFVETFNVEDWEVETEDGWEDVLAIGKTIPYNMYEIILENELFLKCADTHIVIDKNFKECYVENLNVGDIIITKLGLSKIKTIKVLNYTENMYDLEINSNKHTYYTNSILSHNSMWMCNMAAKSILQGHHTAYITLELQEELVNMRIGANLLNIPLDEYDTFCKDQPLLKQKLTNLRARSLNSLGELHVKEFPSSTASANDMTAYLLKAQEILGYKFDNIFIDYINIMKNWRNPNSENTYIKIKQISEDIRAMGQQNNWAIISVTQTNRSGWEANDLGLGSIAESAGLLHTVDILFGIVTNAEMKARGEYFLKCLANRVAGFENTRKRFIIDWKFARIEEDKNSQMQDLDFFINSLNTSHKHPRGQNQIPGSTIGMHEAISQSPQLESAKIEIVPEENTNISGINITGNNLF